MSSNFEIIGHSNILRQLTKELKEELNLYKGNLPHSIDFFRSESTNTCDTFIDKDLTEISKNDRLQILDYD